MTPFEVYCKYLALQQHFKVDSYDYFRYKGKIRAKEETFDKRNDRYSFFKLAKHSDPESVILANLVDGASDYIGTIVSSKGNDVYLAWLKRRERFSYQFKAELRKIEGSLVDSLKVKNGQHPALLKMVSRKSISLETMIVLDDLSGCFDLWNTTIDDPVIWPDIYRKCKKYAGFLQYDRKKMKELLLSDLEDRGT